MIQICQYCMMSYARPDPDSAIQRAAPILRRSQQVPRPGRGRLSHRRRGASSSILRIGLPPSRANSYTRPSSLGWILRGWDASPQKPARIRPRSSAHRRTKTYARSPAASLCRVSGIADTFAPPRLQIKQANPGPAGKKQADDHLRASSTKCSLPTTPSRRDRRRYEPLP